MIYLILAGLVLVAILAINLAKAEPFPLDMEEEEDRLNSQRVHLVFSEWIVRPRAASERFQDLGGIP